jgi:NADPH-dependent curcumin reductase CurA
MKAHEIHLNEYPEGEPTLDIFETAEVELPEVGDGEVRLETLAFSVDPYMRGRMSGKRTYVDPFPLHDSLEGGAVSRVVESKHDKVPEGSLVLSQHGWRDAAVASGDGLRVLPELPASPTLFLGALGMTGFTAWVGLRRIAELEEGETLYVSAAAGAVGSMVGQIAKQWGATVIGSAGSDEKVARLKELGFDEAFNYKTDPPMKALARLAPDGIEVYFDNVGGDSLEAALAHLNDHGRAAICGMISAYNATEPPPGPRTMTNIVTRQLKLEGFLVSDHWEHFDSFAQEVSPLVLDGTIKAEETIRDGLDNAPQAFIDVLRGNKQGKMVVRVND